MKKLLTLLCFALPMIASAQLRSIAESEAFTEPETGYARILALSDGGNAFLHITNKEGIDIRIYDAAHKLKLEKTVMPAYGKLKAGQIEGVYEIGKEITLFINEVDEKFPVLYRLRIDENTGNIIEQKTIGKLDKTSMWQGYAVAFGYVPLPSFLVRYDALSGNVSSVLFNTFESQREKRVELIQYNNTGAEAGRAYLFSPKGIYKYTEVLDVVVVGNTSYVLIYSYNNAKLGGASSELLLASVVDGTATYTTLNNSYKRHIISGVLRYNPISRNLIFLTSELVRTNPNFRGIVNTYAMQFAILDPSNPILSASVDYGSGTIIAKHKRVYKGDKLYAPMPQNIYINDDGSFTLAMEEITNKFLVSTTGTRWVGSELGAAAIVTYSEDGKEISSSLIPKLQTCEPPIFSIGNKQGVYAFDIRDRDNATTTLSNGNQYKSFVFLNGKKNNYVLLNDVEENSERILKGKLINVNGVGKCDAWYYNLTNNTDDYPARQLLFPKAKKKDNNLAILSISSYDRDRDIYTTLKLEDGKVKMAWFTGS